MNIQYNRLVVTACVILHHSPAEILDKIDRCKDYVRDLPEAPEGWRVAFIKEIEPGTAVNSRMYFLRELVEGIPLLTALALKSPPTTMGPVVQSPLSSRLSILSRKS